MRSAVTASEEVVPASGSEGWEGASLLENQEKNVIGGEISWWRNSKQKRLGSRSGGLRRGPAGRGEQREFRMGVSWRVRRLPRHAGSLGSAGDLDFYLKSDGESLRGTKQGKDTIYFML